MKVPPFTLVQLHYFAAAVECGSMTAASRELMVSQSAVSTAIAQLEKALGVTLVLRHHAHGLALTGDLADDPMILLDLPHSGGYFLSLFAERGLEPLIRHRSTGFETVRALVAAGEGFAVLNQKPSHDTTYTGQPVVTVPIRDDIPPLDVVLVRVRGTRATRKAEAFMRLCVETYATSSHR